MYNPQLETFIRVADAGSFNKAAEELFISPPAVIKQINLLEAQLGLTLFVRTHRGLKLTEAGKSLYQDAKYVIGYCRESVERARAAMQKEENVIRIGTSPMTPVQNMVDLWPKFQEYCPDIKFQMIPFENTPENAREILKNLGKNIDVIAGIFDESMLNYRQCSGTLPVIQHALVKDTSDHINIFSEIFENLTGIFRCIFKRNHLKLYIWTILLKLWP